MKNKDIKLIATDMDGTFLNDQHQYDQDLLRKVLASCKEKGIYLAAASGRALLSLKSLFEGFEDQMIFIAENGSVVEFHGDDLYEATMSKDFYLGVFEALKSSPWKAKATCCSKKENSVWVPCIHLQMEHHTVRLLPMPIIRFKESE